VTEPLARLQDALPDRYRIERELGQGGMATVYLATDVKHGRSVAIKVLRPELALALGPERFLREITVAARLTHPNILPLHDSGEAGGLLYYVMPRIEGESLRERLDRDRQLPVDEALRITREVADALAYAHSHGVVHRDIKPENILFQAGHALVTDFGVALAVSAAGDARLTEAGLAIGTPAYMSPEQAMGEGAVDARADVYALGCVLFEMLAGAPPQVGPSGLAVIAQRLSEPAPSVRRARESVPLAIDQALAKALAREPADRFASAVDFVEALTTPVVPRPGRSLAVLPFQNLSPDPDTAYFVDGITEDVVTQLSKIRSLHVIASTSVAALKDRGHDPGEMAAALGVPSFVWGSVRRAGNRVRIVARLVDAASEEQLWAEAYDRDLNDIFAIQADVATRIAAALDVEITGDERQRIGKEPTADLEAYHLYLRGRHCYLRITDDGLRQGLDYFEQAIASDPRFALACAGIATVYILLGMGYGAGRIAPIDAYRHGREAVGTALALDPELGEAHGCLALLLTVAEFDWAGAERAFARALELKPSGFIWDAYGLMLSAQCRYDEALEAQRHARRLDPVIAVHSGDIATTLLRAGRVDQALEEARRLVELEPEYAMGRSILGWACLAQGMRDEGLAAMEAAVRCSPTNTMLRSQLGEAYALNGRAADARNVLRELEDLSRTRHVPSYHLAYVLTGLGEHERALDCLEQACEERSGGIYGVKGSFLFRPLHGHPRWAALLGRMNLA
jgi:serine/threonine protein kinase/tetratricopeptide (TPR) repeat protein